MKNGFIGSEIVFCRMHLAKSHQLQFDFAYSPTQSTRFRSLTIQVSFIVENSNINTVLNVT